MDEATKVKRIAVNFAVTKVLTCLAFYCPNNVNPIGTPILLSLTLKAVDLYLC